MPRTAVKIPVLLSVIALLALAAAPGRSEEPAPSPNAPYPVDLFVGETFEMCRSGQILCPARAPICDDLKVAVPVDTPSGLGFKGVAPGTTLCSAANEAGMRRVFRITVHPPKGRLKQ